jgi:hypothetical protein
VEDTWTLLIGSGTATVPLGELARLLMTHYMLNASCFSRMQVCKSMQSYSDADHKICLGSRHSSALQSTALRYHILALCLFFVSFARAVSVSDGECASRTYGMTAIGHAVTFWNFQSGLSSSVVSRIVHPIERDRINSTPESLLHAWLHTPSA